jgi:O-antigen/teichoic acid export membrane protein
MVVGLVITRYVSQFQALQEMGKLRLFLINSFRNLILLGFFLALLIYMTRSWVADYLKLEGTTPVVVLAVMVFFAFIFPIGTSYLQGLQRFARLGLVLSIGGLSRLVFGILLVLLGLGVSGALTANILAFIPMIFFFYHPLMKIIRIPSTETVEKHTKEILAFSLPVSLAFLGNAGIMNLDLILVKHFFSPESAGEYAAAVVLGRTILYFPGALVTAMYPMVAEAQTLQKDSYGILKKCLVLAFILSGCSLILFAVFPVFLIRILFGHQYSVAGQMLPFYALAMMALTLSSILMQFHLARKNFKFIYVLFGVLVFEWAAIQYIHQSFKFFFSILNLSQWTMMVILGFLTFREYSLSKGEKNYG